MIITRSAAVAVVALAASGASSAHAADRVFGGTTQDGLAMVVQASERGDKLKSVVLSWDARCDDGQYFSDSGRRPVASTLAGFGEPGPTELAMTRNARGRFLGHQEAGVAIGEDLAAVFTTTVAGSLGRTSASGTLKAVVRVIRLSDRAVVASCRTGTLRWNASRRPGLIFGGMTSQREPVVVRLDPARKRVSNLFVGWQSRRCEPPGYAWFGESLGNFPLRAGRFGDAFEQRFPLSTGGERQFDYDVRGSVSRTRTSGTLSVVMTDTLPDGTRATCDTGRVTWSAITG